MIRKFLTVQLDLRSLAALRIGLGLLVLIDLVLRSQDLTTFYTDQGALPRLTLLQIPHPTLLSLYLTVGTSMGVLFLMSLTGLSALGLLLGWNTRWCALATWILHIALKDRNPLICDVGDLYLGLILWWAIFLPLNARYSLDARANPSWKLLPDSYSSAATTGYLLQISVVYAMATINKLDPSWYDTGSAVYYALSFDPFTTELGRALFTKPDLCRYLSYTALATEALIPILLWIPVKKPLFRSLACCAILALHLAILCLLHLGIISIGCILLSVGLWPGIIFQRLDSYLSPKQDSPPTPKPSAYSLSFITQIILGLTCVYIIHLNYALYRGVVVPTPIKAFGYLLRQNQEWSMFAPHPGTDDGWFVAKAQRIDGQSIDLLRHGTPVDLTKPTSVASIMPNQRWRVWLLNLRNREDPKVNESFCNWLARDWNKQHPGPESVVKIELIYVAEPTPPPGQPLRLTPVSFYTYTCPIELYQPINKVFLPLTPPNTV